MGAVSVRNVAVGFGDVAVFNDLSIEIADGEFVVLLGPSGCGKSTLLNAIAGLLDVNRGQIWIGGKNVTWSEPKDRGIGMVFQSYSLYPRMSVRDNLSFGLKIAGAPRADVETRVARAAKMLQLEALLSRKPSELSGGQRQRVAIGRALVRDADVFLFDEPLSNLDAQLRNELRVEIKKLHLELSSTMIYVTHDQVEALTLADRIAVMKAGIIQQIATPHDIYNKPANTFVAGFIGSPRMNMIEGRVAKRGDGWTFDHAEGSVALGRYPFAGAPAERAALLGVRPEHVDLGQSSPERHGATGTVAIVEPMGAETIVWSQFAGKPITLRVDGDSAVRLGDDIAFNFDVARASLFDASTGARL